MEGFGAGSAGQGAGGYLGLAKLVVVGAVTAAVVWGYMRQRYEAFRSAVLAGDELQLRDLEKAEGQDVLNLLYNIAEDQARKEGYVHRGITCNACAANPIRGVRFKCANCVDYDVCENCEARDTHNRNHVFLQIRIPVPPLANPRTTLIAPFYPGLATNAGHLSWDALGQLQRQTHFDQVELEALYEQFKSLSTVPAKGGGIDHETFLQCLGPIGLERNLVTDRIFDFFDRDNDGIIRFGELVSGLSVLCKGSQEEKIVYAFKGYDLENTGFISRDELRAMLRAYFLLSMELVKDVVKAVEEEMVANFQDDGDKPVSSVFTAPIPRAHPTDSRTKPTHAEGYAGMLTSLQLAGERDDLSALMETMSQNAIDEMVESAFEVADVDQDDRLSLEEFKSWAATDSTIIAWFDSLGSVF